MLQSIAWAIRSTINTAVQHTPGQMAFHRYMITASQVHVDWDRVRRLWSDNAAKGVARENASRVLHEYTVGQKVWVKLDPSNWRWKLNVPFEGPYPVLRVYQNGTLRIKHGAYEETIYIHCVKPFVDSDDKRETALRSKA